MKTFKNKDDFYMNNFENLLRKNNINYDLLLLNNTGKTSNKIKFTIKLAKSHFHFMEIYLKNVISFQNVFNLIYSLFFFRNSFKNNFLLY